MSNYLPLMPSITLSVDNGWGRQSAETSVWLPLSRVVVKSSSRGADEHQRLPAQHVIEDHVITRLGNYLW